MRHTPTPPPPATARLDPAMLQEVPFFGGLAREDLAGLALLGHTHRLRQDQILFAQDTEADSLHLLLQGQLKVVQATTGGQQVVLHFFGPGQLAGVFALLGPGQHYPATVSAVLDSVVLTWGPAALREMLRRHPELALNAMRALGQRTQEAHLRLREAAADRVERRLALTLLRLGRQSGTADEAGGISLDFPLTRQDLAEMTGTTLHTVSRILSGWEQAGILAGGRKRVALRDPQALQRIAGAGAG
ncbi:Crp/Fnr family transcriptional regulator [Roseicella aquatilis]|nr:Crp/Fnr family transcriptional regulator [Roseicella aquatilis]